MLLLGISLLACNIKRSTSDGLGASWKFDYQRLETWQHNDKKRFKGIFWVDPNMAMRNIEFDFDYEIYESWRFRIISHTGNHYVVQSTHPYTDRFEFLAEGWDAGDHGPREVRTVPKFDYQRNEIWHADGGIKRFKGTIWLERDLEKNIKIAFDYNYEIYEYWRFKILEHVDNHYVIEITDSGTDSLVFLAQGWDDGWNAPYNLRFGVQHGGGVNPVGPPGDSEKRPEPATGQPLPPAQVEPPKPEEPATADTPAPNTPVSDIPVAPVPSPTPQPPKDEAKPGDRGDQAPWGTPVSYNGRLKVVGSQLLNQNGAPIQLKGVSTHGLQWNSKFANADSIAWLKDSWRASLIRIAMYTDEGGYLQNPDLKNKVHEIVRLAIENGLYVVIDWHILKDRNPMWNIDASKAFFEEMASTYAKYPNVIYEICNEPNGDDVTWNQHIKPYAEQLISVIRRHDPHNIIIVGTPRWSSDLWAAANNPIGGELSKNIMYAFHYYAGSHGWVGDLITTMLFKGLPVFVSEWGVSTADGKSGVARFESEAFLQLLKLKQISWAAWSLADDGNASSLLKPGAEPKTFGKDSQLSEAGHFIKNWIWNP